MSIGFAVAVALLVAILVALFFFFGSILHIGGEEVSGIKALQ